MLKNIKNIFGKIFDPEYYDCSYLKDYSYLKTKGERIKEYETVSKVKSEFWKEHDKYIPKFDPSNGRKYHWYTSVKRRYKYDETSGEIILGLIDIKVYRHDGTSSWFNRHTYIPCSHNFHVKEFKYHGCR